MTIEILIAATFSGLIATAICWLATPIGNFFGLLDSPDADRKLHGHVTPLVGGLAVIIPSAAISLTLSDGPVATNYAVLGLACLVALVLGLIDDRKHIHPAARLLFAILVVWTSLRFVPDFELSFLRFSFISQSFFLEGWSGVFSVLCLVGLLNAVNMADGKNGLVIGMSLIWCVLLALYLPQHSMVLIGALTVTLVVVLLFNLRGRLFLGDSGSYALSIMFGLLAIYAYNINFAYVSADAIALWFVIPVIDCVRLMVWRVIQGRSPFSPDSSHLHHYLDRSMPWSFGLPIYLLLVAVPAALAYVWPNWAGLWMLLTIIVYVLTLITLGRQKPYEQTA
jgi:UDP-GlcNAc:undecaprenyl-phosphate GlcNAc-1-phosphate transferase